MRETTEAKIKLVGMRVAPIYDDCNLRTRMMRQIARELFVSQRTVQRWYKEYKKNRND